MWTSITKAVALCGTLDIIYAGVSAYFKGGTATSMLRIIASGPFGDSMHNAGWVGSFIGLTTHYVLMTAMVVMFAQVVVRVPAFSARPVLFGIGYATLIYLVMYWVVLPLRWPTAFPNFEPFAMIETYVPIILFVGIPMALLFSSALQKSAR